MIRFVHFQLTPVHIERFYVFALLWSIGAFLEGNDRAKLEAFIRNHETIKLDLPSIQSGSHDTVFDYLVGENGEWVQWHTKVEEFTYPDDSIPEYSSILVPNVDNVRTEFLIELIAKQEKGVLLIGEQVSGVFYFKIRWMYATLYLHLHHILPL